MAIVRQNTNSHGSLKDLQVLINNYPELISKKLQTQDQIHWVSPLAQDGFAEYSDDDFIKVLGLSKNLTLPLKEFWPNGGPQWDALGKNDTVFLVEAKAHITELKGPGTRAGGESLIKIQSSLDRVKEYYSVEKSKVWTSEYFQYANRVAHLFFLRNINKVRTKLLFIYFFGDSSVNGPKSIAEWRSGIELEKKALGLHGIQDDDIIELFIGINEIT